MLRLMPDMQVSPLGGILLWSLLALVAIGAVFASGVGGAIIWAAWTLVAIVILYSIMNKAMNRVF